MPNRIIKDSICSSEKISALSDFEFRLWVGLITQADDAGRGDARPAIIKGRIFPLRERVSIRDIDSALHTLAAGSCVSLYSVGGKPYYLFPNWAAHQRIRECKPKYPAPEECDTESAISGDFSPSAAPCGNLRRTAADCGLNTIQYESNPNPNPNPNPNTTARTALDVAMEDFEKMRKEIKKPLTAKARELTLKELEKLAPGDEAAQISILNQSIQRSWQGVFPLSREEKKSKLYKPERGEWQGDDLDRMERMMGVSKDG
jgi:hypothetical protein